MQSAIAQRLQALGKSKFRSKFKLPAKELRYLREKGFEKIEEHARDFIRQRLAPACPENDGKQTPMKNHPVFIAQHATATCCRKCLQKWHQILQGTDLTEDQIDYMVQVIIEWLRRHS
jgi:hypothetical protein